MDLSYKPTIDDVGFIAECFWKDPSFNSQIPICLSQRKSFSETKETWFKFKKLATGPDQNDDKYDLNKLDESFNNFDHEDYELVYFLYKIFTHPFHRTNKSLATLCNVDSLVIERWLFIVYQNYHNVPFHNFGHAFTVALTMYHLIKISGISLIISPHDVLALLVAALCHDIDHPGFNNTFQMNTSSKLAMIYNDVSPLENHHCYITMSLLEFDNRINITALFTRKQLIRFRRIVVSCILSTDMVHHKETLDTFHKTFSPFISKLKSSPRSEAERLALMKEHFAESPDDLYILFRMFMKTSDISNEGHGDEVADIWCDRLFEEFFAQAKYEKDNNLPIASFMDPEVVKKDASQIFFIESLLLPIFEKFRDLFPAMENTYIANAKRHLETYASREKNENMKNFNVDVVKQDSQKILFKCENERPTRFSINHNPFSLHQEGDEIMNAKKVPTEKLPPLTQRRHSSIIGRCSSYNQFNHSSDTSACPNLNQISSQISLRNNFKKKFSSPVGQDFNTTITEKIVDGDDSLFQSRNNYRGLFNLYYCSSMNLNELKKIITQGINDNVEFSDASMNERLRKSSTGSILLSDI